MSDLSFSLGAAVHVHLQGAQSPQEHLVWLGRDLPARVVVVPRTCREGGFQSQEVVSKNVLLAALPITKWGWPGCSSSPVGYELSTVTAESVSELCQQGHLAEAVEALGVLVQTDCCISIALVYSVLKKCVAKRDIVLGRRVHAFTVKCGYQSGTFLCNHILRMYASHGKLQDAMDVFTLVGKPDAFMWSSIISAHVEHGQYKEAIQLYRRMQKSGVRADGHVFVAALKACARGLDLETGQELHAHVLASGVEPDLFVCSCLVDMYAKCGSLEQARRVFEGLGRKDVVTWNALIAGYSQQSMGQEALRLYSAMQEGNARPDSVTFVCLLQACASLGNPALDAGKHIHAQIRVQGHQADVFVASSLVSMYAKCGSLDDARRVFNEIRQKTVVTWNAMIAGCSQQGMGQEALHLYELMKEEGAVTPDSVTFVCLLQACATVGPLALEKGKQLHLQIQGGGHEADVSVANSLVNMYAKCGSLEIAQGIFDRLCQKDVVTWNAMIAGYSQNGMSQEALYLYHTMQHEGLAVPNSITYVCLLQACAHVAALHLGRELHTEIEGRGLDADICVAGCLIHMYGKCGSVFDAQRVFDALPKKDSVVWSALIAGYVYQGYSSVVFDLVQRMRQDGIQPVGITFLCILTACSHGGLVDRGTEVFHAMSREYGIVPTVEHYTCMVDLLGRAGRLDEALSVVSTMPVVPDAAVWYTLLAACGKWSNVEMGQHAFDQAVKLDKNDATAYVLMSNIYTGAQMFEKAQEVQLRRTRIKAWKEPGQSWWTDIDGVVHSFLVGGEIHPPWPIGRIARNKAFGNAHVKLDEEESWTLAQHEYD